VNVKLLYQDARCNNKPSGSAIKELFN